MGNTGTDHAKAAYRAMMAGGRMVVSGLLLLLLITCHVMARHFGLLRLGNTAPCLLCERHLQGHDVGGHDKAWQPANQEQAKAFSHTGH